VALIVEVLAANLAFGAVALGLGDAVLGCAERWTRAERRPPSRRATPFWRGGDCTLYRLPV